MMIAHFLDGIKEGESQAFPKAVNVLQFSVIKPESIVNKSPFDSVEYTSYHYHLLFMYDLVDGDEVAFFTSEESSEKQRELRFKIFNTYMSMLRENKSEKAFKDIQSFVPDLFKTNHLT